MPTETNNQNVDAADPGVENTTQPVAKPEQQQTSKPVSFDEMLKDPKFQSDFDKRVAKALETAKTKWDAESKMSEEDRVNAQLTEREKQIAEREAAQDKREFTSTIRDELTKNSLPVAFAEVLAEGCTKDNFADVLAEIKSEWDKQMTEQLKAGARQKDPLAGGSGTASSAELDLAKFASKNRKVK
jgi:hypothetical protein